MTGKLFTAEYRKTRGRYMLPTILCMIAAELAWILNGRLSEDAVLKGWMMLLYQLPLINALFLPVMAIVISFRLGDLEHKGNMLKNLCCIAKRGSLYDAKLLYGGGLMFVSVIVQFPAVILYGHIMRFGGEFPVKEYLYLLLFTVTATGAVYLLQHALALCCKKTAVPFLVGIIGEFAGVLSMFLPQTFLQKSIPWGYYGMMMFVGAEYDRATRISTYYRLEIDWGGFMLMLAASALLYAGGKWIFCNMDM